VTVEAMEPGWYGEPGDATSERYWDGTQWTPATRRTVSTERRSGRRVIVFGLVLGALGLLAVLLAYLAMDWYTLQSVAAYSGPAHVDRADLASDLGPTGLEHAYFQWAGWLLLAVGAASAILGSLAVPGRVGFASCGTLAGVIGGAATFVASITALPEDLRSDWLKLWSVGPFMGTVGFLFIAVAGVAGLVTLFD
jgi:hypothetical protein